MKLLSFQRSGVSFLVKNRRAILADPMGTGKTAQTVRTLQVLAEMGEAPFPALVVCPNSLKLSTWARESSTWAPELSHRVIDGTASQRRKQLEQPADIYLINWESLRLHSRLAPYGSIALTDKDKEPKELNQMGFRTVIGDEAHRMKDPRAAQTRAMWAVLHAAEFRYLLTGTPVADHIGDLWSLLHGVEPVWFPAKTKYLEFFAEISFNPFGGIDVHGVKDQHREAFFKVVDPLMRRIPKEAALPQLPPKLPLQIRHTPMSPKQKKAYEEMKRDMIAQLDDLLVAPNALAQLMRLNQLASATASVDELGNVTLTGPSPKVNDLVDLLEEMGDDPLVVAAESRQLIELASKELTRLGIKHGLVTGAQNGYEREQAVERFQNGKDRVILLTLGAGAEGLTLTRANRMLFMQESYSEIRNAQGRDRIHRIGSEIHDAIQIIVQITPGTVEENRREIVTTKAMRMEEVVRDRETLRALLGAAA